MFTTGSILQALRFVWSILLLLVWALWWGGLSFYAIFVVPIGTEQVGSVVQGFITQQVTMWLNGLTGVVLLCLVIEAAKERNRWLWFIAFGLTVVELALIYWHRLLTSRLDFAEQSVPSGFYNDHAIYLWLTAAQWLIGLCVACYLALAAFCRFR